MNDMKTLAVLVSGGLDSSVLLGESLAAYPKVYPLYVREGLAWEGEELRHLRLFLDAVHHSSLQPLHVLDMPVNDLYDGHWSITGEDVPGVDTPDEAVFLPGRNVLFLAKAMIWCHLHAVEAVALAVLKRNPFPDATPEFFAAFQDVVDRAVDGEVRVLRPYAELSKVDVLRRGRSMPLGLTFSCIQPREGRHCGVCNKCAERRDAFTAAGMPDPTEYHTSSRAP
jgi:7-cyano-7-deazaguanine synthase